MTSRSRTAQWLDHRCFQVIRKDCINTSGDQHRPRLLTFTSIPVFQYDDFQRALQIWNMLIWFGFKTAAFLALHFGIQAAGDEWSGGTLGSVTYWILPGVIVLSLFHNAADTFGFVAAVRGFAPDPVRMHCSHL